MQKCPSLPKHPRLLPCWLTPLRYQDIDGSCQKSSISTEDAHDHHVWQACHVTGDAHVHHVCQLALTWRAFMHARQASEFAEDRGEFVCEATRREILNNVAWPPYPDPVPSDVFSGNAPHTRGRTMRDTLVMCCLVVVSCVGQGERGENGWELTAVGPLACRRGG